MSFFSQYPPVSGGSNASVGTNGATAPTSSTEIGAIGAGGILQPLQTDAAGNLLVSLAAEPGAPIHVIVDSSALPSGAATSANQTSQITQETAIASSAASIDTKTPTVGQKAMVASSPVVLASDQSSIPVAATLQASSAVIGHVINDAGSAIIGKVGIDQTTPGTTNGVQVNAALPAGTNVIGHVIVDSSSGPTDATASGNITTQNLNPNSGVATAASTVAVTSLNGQTSWSVQVTGVYTGALTPQVTVDGSNWIALSGTAITNINSNVQSGTITSAAVGIFELSAPPCAQLRITALGAMTGTATVSLRVSSSTTRVGLDSPIPAGTAIIGALSANQSTNVAQINAVAPLMGNGVTGTGSQRVTISSDNTAFSVNAVQSGTWTVQPGNTANTTAWLTTQKGLASANAPVQNTYSGVNITTAAYTQLIASTTSATTYIDIFDSSGQAMILATGAGGAEVIQAYIPPGGDAFYLAIPSGTRVAYKALTANATTGYLLLNLRG